MMKFNKILIGIIAIIIIVLIFFIIYQNIKKDNKETFTGEVSEIIKTSKINSIEEIKNPKEIIYYINNEKKILNNGTKEYEEIVYLNKKRVINEWGLLKTSISGLNENTPNNWLEYKYDNFAIYFSLKEDEKNCLWVPDNDNFMEKGAYGYISSASEINEYIKQINI